jgi:RNA polymerase sigma-70 factor (ECF subfamily)
LRVESYDGVTVNVDDASAGDRLGSGDDQLAAQQLVRQAAAGDHAAWERIYRAVYPRLRAFAIHHVGNDTADDVVSETMTRAVAGIGGFRWTPAGIEPWLFGIARRVVADHHRRAGRLRRWSRAVAAPAALLPGDAAELADEHAAVRAAFSRLSDGDRELLELRVIAGLTPEQTATMLGKRPGAVRAAQSRALARLRQRLQRGSRQGPEQGTVS